ncbi:MAG: hypothetical protein DHS20C21_24040 [Gemmatimonadota bacterium]|nr:MAG: hypothetical protein DHS20C21_24040 [Gemmatimonadota bacterium]
MISRRRQIQFTVTTEGTSVLATPQAVDDALTLLARWLVSRTTRPTETKEQDCLAVLGHLSVTGPRDREQQ